MPAEAAPALVPEGKRPAELVGDRAVLVRGHITFLVEDTGREDFVPLAAHVIGAVLVGNGGPQRSVRQPLVPEGRFRASSRIVQPKQSAQSSHFLLVTRHMKSWEIVGRRRAGRCRLAGERGGGNSQ